MTTLAPSFQASHHARQDFRRVLEVAIHQYDGVTAGNLQTCGQGCLVAKIARKLDYGYARIAPLDFHQQRE